MSKHIILPLGKRRPSKSADATRAARIARELAMTPMERIDLALRLGRQERRPAKSRGR